ncbi:DUF7109 family protein [Natronobacterium gregoryi]|uniref:Uncharacterized protein n=2 Tax=Natronobacterium gregoryi TaxID=44930 RepID=L0AFB2_NATGS|nr:hypothetical protein [Natronobacterium gregoryi]AFZ71832.1 hypothetical protein Natgr_0582 [Natronobacterium gregoryi SP2]ELY72994.1 hypothetical protein C490_02116 [Natronobacterium gregoryi SP2]PLK19136.1 hypothetical protein CYV19_16510 [Natronobacterium gregoryi SP2]SFJ60346.1 hypothetical protein SAMN05443661_14514 [Natronobacterium gregoryi]
MEATADELAGVVDLFGGLTRAELDRALSEAAFRADGGSVDGAAVETTIDDALASFALVEYDDWHGADPLLVAGPTAFPAVPDDAEDIPYILEIERRRLDRETLGESVRDCFADDVADAIEAVDDGRIRELIDVSYDVESWAPVDLADERSRLEAALE